ncbi:MAG: TlpA family protein disulfide reductase [Pseudomonadota bacterium]|nr:TlpA family protein disulfide reductase [Pseudomonadota bacterium]
MSAHRGWHHIRQVGIALTLAACALTAEAGMADLINGVKVGAQLPPAELHFLSPPPASPRLRLIDFWATWCEPCRESIPALGVLQTKYAGEGLAVIGVTAETLDVVQAFQQKLPMAYTTALDSKPGLNSALHIRALPYAIMVAADGTIVWRGQPGEIDDALLRRLLHPAP